MKIHSDFNLQVALMRVLQGTIEGAWQTTLIALLTANPGLVEQLSATIQVWFYTRKLEAACNLMEAQRVAIWN